MSQFAEPTERALLIKAASMQRLDKGDNIKETKLESCYNLIGLKKKSKSVLKRIFRGRNRKQSKNAKVDCTEAIESRKGACSVVAEQQEKHPISRELQKGKECSLQTYLEALLHKERGYQEFPRYETLCTGYYRTKTTLQEASYGPCILTLVKSSDTDGLMEILAGGLSPNACNPFHESIIHMACRHGDLGLLDVLLQAGGSVQVSDDYGRTPLHDAFWAPQPAFGVVQRLLEKDPGMIFLKDKRGFLPMDYVSVRDISAWKNWLDIHVPLLFPVSHTPCRCLPELATTAPFSVPLAEPKSTLLSTQMIKLVAKNAMTLQEVQILARDLAGMEDDGEVETEIDTDFGENEGDNDSENDCDSEHEEGTSCSDEDESEIDLENNPDLQALFNNLSVRIEI